MTTRRNFIAATALMAAATSLTSSLSLAEAKEEKEKEKVQLIVAMKTLLKASRLLLISATLMASAQAQQSNEELAKQAQNPVAKLISVPFQNNTNFNVGPLKKNQNILNIQPVIPISLGTDWNLITRTILPVISQPEFIPGEGRTNGLGDTNSPHSCCPPVRVD